MIYKYTKCESVIAKILSDSNMSEKNMRITDIREWIFEAVEKIGAPVQYIQRESGEDGCPVLKLMDGQVEIPCDLETLVAVAWAPSPSGPWIPARSNEQTFKGVNKMSMTTVHHHPDQYIVVDKPYHRSQVLGINYSSKLKEILENRTDEVTYFVKPGWIVLNRQKGFVKLSYRSIATDERGYPLIPDLASYQEAIYWYVMMKLNFPKFLNGSLGGKAKYNFNTYVYLQQQWNFYRNQAYAEAMMPNEGQMRSIKHEWNKLIPDWDSDDTFFTSSGQRQLNVNDRYGY